MKAPKQRLTVELSSATQQSALGSRVSIDGVLLNGVQRVHLFVGADLQKYLVLTIRPDELEVVTKP